MLKWFKVFSLLDWINLAFLIVLVCFFIYFKELTSNTGWIILIYLMSLLLTIWMIVFRNKESKNKFYTPILTFYPIGVLLFLFSSLSLTSHYFNSSHYDAQMAALDQSLFGVHPSLWMEKYSTPWLTEIMYIFYFLYFPLPLPLLYTLVKRNKFMELERMLFTFFVCYYGAFLSYFCFPVKGPKFFLADKFTKSLDGIWLSDPIRNLINVLEPSKFDCFPSMHTAILLMVVFTAFRVYRDYFYWIVFLVPGILLSLVYCRYHYIADIIAGIAWACFSYFAGGYLFDKIKKYSIPHFGTTS